MSKVLSIIKIAIKSPIQTIKKINLQNIRSLAYAIKYEDQKTIEDNFSKLINTSDINSTSHNITTINTPTNAQNEFKQSIQQMEPVSIQEKEFYNTWDDKYIVKHLNDLDKFDSIESIKGKNIAIIADLNLPQCKKYRVIQKIELLKRKKIECDFSHWLDVPRSLKLMQFATTVIFYRIPYSKLSAAYLNEAIRLNLNIGYDIDDPIFDSVLYKKNENLNILDKKERAELLRNTRHYVNMIRQCDFVTTSTPYLKIVLSRFTKSPIYLWRNLMDAQSINAAEITKNINTPRDLTSEKFVIGYMSGSRAHEADFNTAKSAIIKILDKYEHAELLVVGFAESAKELETKFKKRITIIPFSDYYDYLSTYHKIDLNIIPLLINDFNECKSAIRYLESSLLSVPTIVSHVGDFKNIIDHKNTGYFIYTNSQEEWIEGIEWCIKMRHTSYEMGQKAEAIVRQNYSTLEYNTKSIENQIFDCEF